MSNTVCQHCGCAELEKDAARGDTVCTSCGLVLEENAIVSEIQFAETGGGGHSVVGQFVGSDMPNKISIGGMPGIDSRASREVTLQNGRRRIQEVASQLRLNQHCVDTAFNFFKMAVARGLTRGRRSTHVVAACLYITCRLEGTTHFLLDFSDVLQVNVFELGKVFSFLARSLYITLPPTDPCIYVLRFAHALEFGDKEHEVANVALRLVQRMKRDWMAIGRRPTGLCGAALILASRYHNFNRTIADVMRVVNIGEAVLRKRLEEFGQTPTSALSLEDFQTVDLEEECDPPAFRESRLKAKEKQKELELEVDKLDQLEPDLIDMEKEIDRMLDEKRNKKSRYGSCSALDTPSSSAACALLSPGSSIRNVGEDDSNDEELDASQEFLVQETFRGILSEDEIGVAVRIDDDDSNLDGSNIPCCSTSTTPADRFRIYRPTLESLGIKSPNKPATAAVDDALENGTTEDGSLDLNGIDDDEIDGYLLRSDEIEVRKQLWNLNHEPYMREMEEKRLKREEEARLLEAQGGGPSKKRRSRPRKKIQAATAGEAIEKIVQEKKLSSKINYEVLKSLNDPVDKFIYGGSPSATSFATPKIIKDNNDATDKSHDDDNQILIRPSSTVSKPTEIVTGFVGVRKKPRPNLFSSTPLNSKKPKFDIS